MNRHALLVASTMCLALSACGKGDKAAPEASASPAQDQATAVSGVTPEAVALADVDGKSIPEGMRGRFGLVAADCTTTKGDDKGLLTVGANDLKFYESVAKLGKVAEGSPTHLKASFAYSGEGMEWTREVTLDLENGGKTLIMHESGEDAVPGPRSYTRCG